MQRHQVGQGVIRLDGGVNWVQEKILARDIDLKRPYDPPSGRDGTRILIDLLWPLG